MSLSAPKVKEPESNQRLADAGRRLYNTTKEHYGGIQEQNRRNTQVHDGRSRHLQTKAGAGALEDAGPAIGAYGYGGVTGPTRQTGAGEVMNAVRNNQNARAVGGQLNLLRDAAGGFSDSTSQLGALTNLENNRNQNRTLRQSNTNNAIGGLAGLGVGLYRFRQTGSNSKNPAGLNSRDNLTSAGAG